MDKPSPCKICGARHPFSEPHDLPAVTKRVTQSLPNVTQVEPEPANVTQRRGPPLLGERPMTAAERKRRQRGNA